MTTKSSSSRRARRSAQTAAAATVVEPSVEAARQASHQRWQEEYGYVFHDLRTLLIVSVALFAIIIILGFFL